MMNGEMSARLPPQQVSCYRKDNWQCLVSSSWYALHSSCFRCSCTSCSSPHCSTAHRHASRFLFDRSLSPPPSSDPRQRATQRTSASSSLSHLVASTVCCTSELRDLSSLPDDLFALTSPLLSQADSIGQKAAARPVHLHRAAVPVDHTSTAALYPLCRQLTERSKDTYCCAAHQLSSGTQPPPHTTSVHERGDRGSESAATRAGRRPD